MSDDAPALVTSGGSTAGSDDAFFRQLCLHSALGVVATDPQLRVRVCNPSAGRILGSTPEGLIGRSVLEIVPAERRDLARRLIERVLHRREPSELQFRYQDPAGRAVHLYVSLSPVILESGSCVGVALFLRDVTSRIEAQRARAREQKMAALGSLAGAVAHYFNNLLTCLIPKAEVAQKSNDPLLLRDCLQFVLAMLTRAGRLTAGLRAFAEGVHAAGQEGNVSEVTLRFIEELQSRLATTGIRLEYDIEPLDHRLPEAQLYTILEQLTANACEAMPEGGLLEIRLLADPAGRGFFLRVSDTGCGIPEALQEHVFEPFFTTKGGEGTSPEHHLGLGLAVVHGLVRSMGGSITLCSAVNAGTTCSIHFP